MTGFTSSFILNCKAKLLEAKASLLNQLREQRTQLATRVYAGDEADLGAQASDEAQLYIRNQRIRSQLLEVELALARIDSGAYGICEETQEPIEAQRLLSLPWTRLSIEGAELREAETQRHSS